ncbi:gamma carbonic anhydrase family protein [Pseudarthrobacter sulfonivorans]|uniref:gamma carbonic anhydrase family protein n=1 Tax=Pseudarthrobacter sulfonivorans TaxID=121292 RepID=UPI00277D4453|nr:gamma carbonic anhydrase family protein [Pseudarthrobacter sulfonivorans]MDP9997500.1 carbonic anhydrase/acetyltransferase-like protein (isoleucine patch superfamily) [Pseudarthrobacter sulfonivorans]
MTSHILAVDGRNPALREDTWIAPTAVVVGSATIGAGTGIFYGAVVRADTEDISIGAGSNVQDCAVVHADPGYPARIGSRVSVGHGAVLHGCTVGDGTLIGMNATVLNGAVIGAGSLIAANALVLEGMEVPPGSLVAGVPGKVRRPLTPQEIEHCNENAARYLELTRKHRGAAPLVVSGS